MFPAGCGDLGAWPRQLDALRRLTWTCNPKMKMIVMGRCIGGLHQHFCCTLHDVRRAYARPVAQETLAYPVGHEDGHHASLSAREKRADEYPVSCIVKGDPFVNGVACGVDAKVVVLEYGGTTCIGEKERHVGIAPAFVRMVMR